MRYILSRLKSKRNIQTYRPAYNHEAFMAAERQWYIERPAFDIEPFPTVTQHFVTDNITYGLHVEATEHEGITVRVISITSQAVQEEILPITFNVELLIRTIRWVLNNKTEAMGCMLSQDNGGGYFVSGVLTNSSSLYMLPEDDIVTLIWTVDKHNYRDSQNAVLEQQYSFDKLYTFCEQLETYAVSYASFEASLEEWNTRRPQEWQFPPENEDGPTY